MSGALRGRRVLVTRRREQAAGLVAALEALGAEVVAVPLLQLTPPADPAPLARAVAELHCYDWIVFTSANAVEAVADRLAGTGSTLPPRLKVACVGPATRDTLAARVPEALVALEPANDFSAEGLLAAFATVSLPGARILLPASERARSHLAEGLRARGAAVDAVPAYGVAAAGQATALAETLAQGVDLVTLASPSAVEAFLDAAGPAGREVPAAVIGPVTEAAARRAGLRVVGVASSASATALAEAVARSLTPNP